MKLEDIESQIEYEVEQEILFDAIKEEVENDDKEREKESLKKDSSKLQKRLKSGLQIKTVVLLLLTLLVNTYAWFIYVSQVSTGVKMHIKSWEFELSDGEQSQDFSLIVDQIYPGMPTAQKEITAKNNGEMSASLVCEVTRIQILDEEYIVGVEYPQPDGSVITYDSEQLLQKLLNDYPFKVKIYINGKQYTGPTDDKIDTGKDTQILIEASWPYETGNIVNGVADGDETDTEWGQKSYNYMTNNTNPDQYSIQVDVTVKAIQYDKDESGTIVNP